jgi:hypothetical protein
LTEPPPKPMPPDFEELDFSVENEEWNEYELKDGTTIRARVTLTKIHQNPYNPNNFGFKLSQPVWVVYAPYSSRGGTNVKMGEKVEGPKFEVHVNRSHEPWNVYRILKTGQRLKIKLEVTEVRRFVDKFDADGLPVYEVPNGVNITVMPPESGARP